MSSRPPEPQSPLHLVRLASVGFTFVGTVVAGVLIGFAVNRLLHWPFAVPLFVIFGFAAGFVSLFRTLQKM